MPAFSNPLLTNFQSALTCVRASTIHCAEGSFTWDSLRSTSFKSLISLPLSSCFEIVLKTAFQLFLNHLLDSQIHRLQSVCTRWGDINNGNIVFFKSFKNASLSWARNTSKIHKAHCDSGNPSRFLFFHAR